MIIVSPPMATKVDSTKIKKLVSESVYKPEFIAESVGIKRTSLRQLANGYYTPSPSVIKLLALFFKVPESYFYDQAA